MISDSDLRRYLRPGGRHAFRREQIVLPTGQLYGDVEEEWQRENIWRPLDDPNLRLHYWELHRGAGKTAMMAMEALATGILESNVRAHFVAADEQQAGIAFSMLTQMISANESLASSFKVLKNEVIVPATNTRIRVESSDWATSYGLGGQARAFRVFCDELWAWRNRELWDSFWTACAKSKDWKVIVASNCGHDTDSVCFGVREMCRTKVDPRFYYYGPEGVVAGWISSSEIETQRRSLPAPTFDRLWGNVWTASEHSFLSAEQWDACKEDYPPLTDRTPVVLGLDAGVRHDSFGIVGVTRHPQRHQDVMVRAVGLWTPPKGGSISFHGPGSPDEFQWPAEQLLQHAFLQAQT